MHPSLTLSQSVKARIPLVLRRRAIAAAQPTASLEERLIFISSVPPGQNDKSLLPVFHALLDPTRIPAIIDKLESLGSPAVQENVELELLSVSVAVRACLKLLECNSAPTSAFPDMWGNLWPWILFNDTYGDILPMPATVGKPRQRYAEYVLLICSFHSNTEGEKILIPLIPDICRVFGRAWPQLVRAKPAEEDYEVCDAAINNLVDALSRWVQGPHWSATACAELIAGTGGTAADLASLIVSRFAQYFPIPEDTPKDQLRSCLNNLSLFALQVAGVIETYPCDPALRQGLMEAGLVSAQTLFCRALSDGTFSPSKEDLGACCSILLVYLDISPRHRWITEALRAGYFALTLKIVPRLEAEVQLKAFGILTTSTVFHSSLSALRQELLDVRALDSQVLNLKTKAPHAHASWEAAMTIIQDRFKTLDAYNTGELRIPVPCYNEECARISIKKEKKCCGGCRVAHYCSISCQMQDWRDSHRHFCWFLAPSHDKRQWQIAPRDNAFFQALTYHEFCIREAHIARLYLDFARKSPTKIPYIMFDYRERGLCSIVLDALDEIDSGLSGDTVRAVIDSGHGRILFHIMRWDDGDLDEVSLKLLPPFFATNFWDGLSAIAAKVRSGADGDEVGLDQYHAEVVELMKDGMGKEVVTATFTS
ncbi:hypothetical protein R3P38DRAFT_2857389 [Favolaschia claudopus]|uniref:MYND-type domain-containing protein n=1 Tax=Favolaschia claudopus TaxID=2862362 RepID=A0AAW0DM28_9AGAR